MRKAARKKRGRGFSKTSTSHSRSEEREDVSIDKEFVSLLNKYSPHVKFGGCGHEAEAHLITKWGFHFEGEEYTDAVNDGAYWCDGSYCLESAIAEYLTFSYRQLVKKSQRIRELEAKLALTKLFNDGDTAI